AVERLARALVVQRREPTGAQIYTLDGAAPVSVCRRAVGQMHLALLPIPRATVIADIDGAIGTDGRTVRAPAQLGDRLAAAVGSDACQRAPAYFDQHHGTVRHRNRTLRELQPFGNLLHREALLSDSQRMIELR